METVADTLQKTADRLAALLQTLLQDYAILNEPRDQTGDVVVINTSGDHFFRELSEEGRQVQAKLFEEYRLFSSLLKVLLRKQPPDTLRELREADAVVQRTIELQATWCHSTREVLDRAKEKLTEELSLVRYLYDSSSGAMLYAPDTNALLYNPHLDRWEFDNGAFFTLVLTPTILEELDILKIEHRNPAVREKAEGVIRQIKELRRRGRLTEGVTLVGGKSMVKSLAVEPNMNESLPWLDTTNRDDRFVASVIELMRTHPKCTVVAVSRDINLQNKLEFARIPFVEPPEPVSSSSSDQSADAFFTGNLPHVR